VDLVIPSVKNVIMVDGENLNDKKLIVSKCGDDAFYLKAEHPFTPLSIMGYMMSSFNFKFVTQ
jgi:hypothetical protein